MSTLERIYSYCQQLPVEHAMPVFEYIHQQTLLPHGNAVLAYLSPMTPDNAGLKLGMLFNYKMFNHAPIATVDELVEVDNIMRHRFGTHPQFQNLCITVGSMLNQLPRQQVLQMVSTAQYDDIITNNPLMKTYLWNAERSDDAQRGKQLTRQSIYVCPNPLCGSSDVTWNESQTRSADEPATIFISCLACGHNSAIQG